MGAIYAVHNLKNNCWKIDTNQIGGFDNDLFIKFENTNSIKNFKEMKFGFELKKGNDIKQYGIFPPAGVRYRSSDQNFKASIRLELQPEEIYILYLWANYDKEKIRQNFEIKNPKPKKIFESWQWNNSEKIWQPPVAKPENGVECEWDEQKLSWKLIDE